MNEAPVTAATANAPAPRLKGKRACIIGAGFSGLALAIRLQASGCETTVVEARDRVGGLACTIKKDGFVFDAGPTAIPNLSAFRALWGLAGQDMSADIEMLPIIPACRYHWPDGTHFDFSGDELALRAELARIAPADLAGFGDFMRYCSRSTRHDRTELTAPDLSPRRLGAALKKLFGDEHWRSAVGAAARLVDSPHLQQALTVHLVMQGANPCATGSARLLDHTAAHLEDLWHPRGGVGNMADAMRRLFERLGGTVRLSDPIVKLHTIGNRIGEVETCSGWRERFDVVASNADTVHTYRDLLGESDRGRQASKRIASRRFAPATFTVHFALEGSWPGIPHRMVLFGPRYAGLLQDIFEHGVLPRDQLIFLSHPSVTDSTLSPEGKSVFQATVPVAHLGKLALDWEQVGPMLEQRIIAEIGRRLVPDITDRVITSFHTSPRHNALDYSLHLGSSFGMAPLGTQCDWLRPHLKDDKLVNLYLTGAGTFPGAGLDHVLSSANLAGALMEKDLAG